MIACLGGVGQSLAGIRADELSSQHSTITEEQVDPSDYWDYTDALQQRGRFLDEVYQHKRIHFSLGYLVPAEFEQQ
jgi:transposase InsO family protein